MLFPPDFLTRLEYLSIVSKRVFRGTLLAQRRTRQAGVGIEFSDHRHYTAGDDLRYLDWNVYARHGELLLKRFQEEQDLHIYLLLDCSRSMTFGTPPRFDLARQLTAGLAYIGLADLDRIAVVAYADEILAEFPLSRGKARILPLMQFLQQLPATGRDTHLTQVVRSLLHRGPRAGLAIVISDLLDEHGFRAGLDQLRCRDFDIHVVQLHDPAEASPTLLGDVELEDLESGTVRRVILTEKQVRTYRQLFGEHQLAVKNYCRHYGLGCTQSDTQVGCEELILRMMRNAATAGAAASPALP